MFSTSLLKKRKKVYKIEYSKRSDIWIKKIILNYFYLSLISKDYWTDQYESNKQQKVINDNIWRSKNIRDVLTTN